MGCQHASDFDQARHATTFYDPPLLASEVARRKIDSLLFPPPHLTSPHSLLRYGGHILQQPREKQRAAAPPLPPPSPSGEYLICLLACLPQLVLLLLGLLSVRRPHLLLKEEHRRLRRSPQV